MVSLEYLKHHLGRSPFVALSWKVTFENLENADLVDVVTTLWIADRYVIVELGNLVATVDNETVWLGSDRQPQVAHLNLQAQCFSGREW